MTATRPPRSLISLSASRASAAEEARMIRYASPYRRRRSRAIARDTEASSSTVRMAGWPMAQSSGMRERGGVRDLEGHVVLVTPPPVLTRLVRLHERMAGGVEVGGGVLAG